MKAICVRQPWAHLIAEGVKTLEVRSRPARYRGPLIIVAARSTRISPEGLRACDEHRLAPDTLTRGAAVALVEMFNSRPMEAGDTAAACCPLLEGHHVWALRLVRRLDPPIPMMGQLNFFTPPADVVERITLDVG